MHDPHRTARSIARIVGDQRMLLAHRRSQQIGHQIEVVDDEVRRFAAVARLYPHCVRRGWHTAAQSVLDRLRRITPDLIAELHRLPRKLGQIASPVPGVGMREIAEDLDQLESEFGPWVYDAVAKTLSVVTESIELEGVYLGPFRIQLALAHLAECEQRSPYEVIALDPNPAVGNSGVTHPHVSDDRLCEGDGTHSIRSALTGGRLADFFLTVAAILRTYNPTSPYVPLAKWEGESCGDCGATIARDEHHTCRRFDGIVCGDCATYCNGCDEPHCADCLEPCAVCKESSCRDCLIACDSCGDRCCSGCLDENHTCTTCQEADTDDDDNATPDDDDEAIGVDDDPAPAPISLPSS